LGGGGRSKSPPSIGGCIGVSSEEVGGGDAAAFSIVMSHVSLLGREAGSGMHTTLDGQTDSVKTNRIRLSVVNPSAVRWLGTALDGQIDCVKTNRIRLSVVDPSAVRRSEQRSTARQIVSKLTARHVYRHFPAIILMTDFQLSD
jgi:hypothetical protein